MTINIKRYGRADLKKLKNIPAVLRALPQWVCWKLMSRGVSEKPAKVPVSPRTGSEASVTDSDSWGTFDEALACFTAKPSVAGLGFVFTAEDPFTGVDVDDCRDAVSGALGEWAAEIVKQLDSYTEVSPSGTGIKIIVRAVSPGAATRRAKVEIYSHSRYFTITGEALEPVRPVTERQAALAELYLTVFGRASRDEPPVAAAPCDPAKLARVREITDEALLALAAAAANGEKFTSLWNGETSGHGGDRSAADLALCAILCYWTRADGERVDRLFRRSGLHRAKWDARRGAATYGQLTVGRALAGTTALYDPDRALALGGTRNDVGNTEVMVQLHGDEFAYLAPRREWLRWRATRWEPEAHAALMRAAKDVSAHLLRAGLALADEERARALRWGIQAAEAYRLNNIEQLARYELEAPAAGLNADPYLLACANGVLDLRTGQLREGRREDWLTRGSPVAFEAGALCPRFDKFLREIMEGDDELVAYLWRVLGYCLTGDTTERAFFILHGAGRNGKTTLVETLTALLGQGSGGCAQRARFTTFLRKQAAGGANDDVAGLAGARVVVAAETEENATLDSSLVKELTGGDVVRARHLYGREFEFRPAFKLFLVTNHVPQIRESSHALWDRLHYVPFTFRVPEDRVDRALPLRLLGELEGILARASRACLEWQRNGLDPPARVLQLRRELQVSMDLLAEFLEDRCELGAELTVVHRSLYGALRRWLAERGVRWAPHSVAFGRWLRERGLVETRGGANVRGWTGLRLRAAEGGEPAQGSLGDL